jgi:hypothetical protein
MNNAKGGITSDAVLHDDTRGKDDSLGISTGSKFNTVCSLHTALDITLHLDDGRLYLTAYKATGTNAHHTIGLHDAFYTTSDRNQIASDHPSVSYSATLGNLCRALP